MIYFCYDEDSLKRFGDKQYNKFLRILFKCTDIYSTEINIEHSIRIAEPADIQPFLINRLLADPVDHITVTAEERIPT